MSVIIPGMNMDHERVSIRPRNVWDASFLSVLTEVASALCPWCQHLNGVLLHYRTTSHCWPDGKIRAQKVWLNCTTRRLCGTMIHNPTCSISTAGSLRPPSRTSKSFTTMTVSTIPPNGDRVIAVSLVSVLKLLHCKQGDFSPPCTLSCILAVLRLSLFRSRHMKLLFCHPLNTQTASHLVTAHPSPSPPPLLSLCQDWLF